MAAQFSSLSAAKEENGRSISRTTSTPQTIEREINP
jgi:hypothetical protein